MGEPSPHTLMERLDRLERENRWWKVLCGSATALLTLTVFLGAAPSVVPEEIKARRFVLVDTEGKTRAQLGEGARGIGLELFARDGSSRARLMVRQHYGDAPILHFVDDSPPGWPRLALALTDTGEPSIELLNPTVRRRALYEGGGPNIARVRLGLEEDGSPALYLNDQQERPRAVLGRMNLGLFKVPDTPSGSLQKTGTLQSAISALTLFDERGKVWKAP